MALRKVASEKYVVPFSAESKLVYPTNLVQPVHPSQVSRNGKVVHPKGRVCVTKSTCMYLPENVGLQVENPSAVI